MLIINSTLDNSEDMLKDEKVESFCAEFLSESNVRNQLVIQNKIIVIYAKMIISFTDVTTTSSIIVYITDVGREYTK